MLRPLRSALVATSLLAAATAPTATFAAGTAPTATFAAGSGVPAATVADRVTPSASATALPGWRTGPTTRAASPQARMPQVVDLTYATHGRFDRVVLEIRGYRPGYAIDYARRLYQDGSGRRVRLAGRQKMYLRLTPAYAHDRRGRPVYDGPRKQRAGLPTLRGVAFTGDFEGTVSFGFGLDRRAPYRIFTLTQPRRIVVDFKADRLRP